MGFLHNLMNKLGRYRLIPDRRTGEDYMHRYYLFLKDHRTIQRQSCSHRNHILLDHHRLFEPSRWLGPFGGVTGLVLDGRHWSGDCTTGRFCGRSHWTSTSTSDRNCRQS